MYCSPPQSCSSSGDEHATTSRRPYPCSEADLNVRASGLVFLPPISNPVDLAADGEWLGIADYDNGAQFINTRSRRRIHFDTAPYRIAGVQWLRSVEASGVASTSTAVGAAASSIGENANVCVVLLAYCEERWSCRVHKWPTLHEEYAIDCPLQPSVPSWARRKICVVGSLLYLLATSERRTAIYTLQLPSKSWFVEATDGRDDSTTVCLLAGKRS